LLLGEVKLLNIEHVTQHAKTKFYIKTGYAPGFYTAADLRSDYRRGLVMGITFCLFAMPMLAGNDADEVDAARFDDVPEGQQVNIF
jgi:hypothetical protein